MKAVTRSQYGPPEVLSISSTELPKIKENDILVKVYATTVNRTDCVNLTGKPYIVRIFTGLTGPMRTIPGTDFAGEVIEVGKEVQGFQPGDQVFGFDDHGLSSMAEYLSIPENKAIQLFPEGISYSEAVASAEGVHYAINFLNKVNLQEGQTALVNGGTGAIGSALIQLLKYNRVQVVATGPTNHLSTLHSLGADRIIDYHKEDFTRDHEKFDYVFDSVGKSTFEKCKPILKPNGIYISSELGPNWENPLLSITTAFSGEKKVKFPFPSNIKASLKFISGLLGKGDFKPLIDRSYAMEQAKEAYEYVMSGQKIGNVILKIQPNNTSKNS
ncbi:NAD(P)-dependent alcohol dehydrogenase [Salinimicrobium soli]|uniref:NAD(P)-dependent alcohol dehydrogenase n=1 Tax=Salinimicrobium soli TaxID=1254399 RepID=UPI003AAD31F2